MAGGDSLAELDATAQAELVRRKEIKPIELVDAAIERIERVNPKINAVVTPMYEQARRAAEGAIPDGPFRGVPYLLKDLLASYAGARMTSGSRFMREFVSDHDSELVARLKRAGLIIVGKTNAPEFGILPTTEPKLFGPSRNPWNLERTTGGSSGGSAAAVAAGIVPMAHANDGGGSIRIPSSCCGVFGLKPTRARNPLGPDYGDVLGGLVAEHAVTRSVRDSAALLDATAGAEIGDPYCAPPAARPFAKEAGANPGRLRIAVTRQPMWPAPIHRDCVAAVEDAAKLCTELGHEVFEAAPAVNGPMLIQAFTAVWAVGVAQSVEGSAILRGRMPEKDELETLTWALYEKGRQVTGAQYLMAVAILQQTARAIGKFMTECDVWLTAVLAEPPVPLGSFDSPEEDPMRGFKRAVEFCPFTALSNVTGQPAMSAPLYWNAEGLPVGAHFAGRFGDEATLFRLAAQLEAARPWASRRPTIA